MKETELLPCPFCGGEAKLEIGDISLYDNIFPKKYELRAEVCVKCSVCHFSEGKFTAAVEIDHTNVSLKGNIHESITVKRLAKRWNRRVNNEQREAN